ncbi:MAG: DivIVA domain-containing protein [Micrococcaceae bacterium]
MQNSFPVVPAPETGYNRQEVDKFIHRARQSYLGKDDSVDLAVLEEVAFDEEIGGYDFEAVDNVLDRLEEGFKEKFGGSTQATVDATQTQAIPLTARAVLNTPSASVKATANTPTAALSQQAPRPVKKVVRPAQQQVRQVQQIVRSQQKQGPIQQTLRPVSAPPQPNSVQKHQVKSQVQHTPQIKVQNKAKLPQTLNAPRPIVPQGLAQAPQPAKTEAFKNVAVSLPENVKPQDHRTEKLDKGVEENKLGVKLPQLKKSKKAVEHEEKLRLETGQVDPIKATKKQAKKPHKTKDLADVKTQHAHKKKKKQVDIKKKQDTDIKNIEQVDSNKTQNSVSNELLNNKKASGYNPLVDENIPQPEFLKPTKQDKKAQNSTVVTETTTTTSESQRVQKEQKKHRIEPIKAEKKTIDREEALNNLVQNVKTRRQQQLPPTPEIKAVEPRTQVQDVISSQNRGQLATAATAGVATAGVASGMVHHQSQSSLSGSNRAQELAGVMDAIQARMALGNGKRFRKATYKTGYSVDEVDQFSKRIERYLQNREMLSADEVKNVTFSSAHALDAYSEAQVDALLNRLVEIIHAS